MKTFQPYSLKNITLKNRIVMAPMCMNMAIDGKPTDFHYIHYGNAALGEVGLIIVEATGVTEEGRILEKDLGIWNDEQIIGHREIVRLTKKYGSHVGIQLGHAGRKCGIDTLTSLAPSPLPFSHQYQVPKEMTKEDIKRVQLAFQAGAKRSLDAGYELIELHGAHGYLIHEFLSPVSNKRLDEYGGSRENRVRFLIETIAMVKEVIPKDFPLTLRVSAADYVEGGIDIDEMVEIIDLVKKDLDLIHVSSGGLDENQKINTYPGYQVKFAETIKRKCEIDTIAMGLITLLDQVEEILQHNRADLVALGRMLLRDPFMVVREGQGEARPLNAYTRGFPNLPRL
ncbi:MAG: NADH:flavin oxidoreductase/NADH oxidase [Clostridium sp.]|nr:NADH:flavin oxidoreductase/NADH oxidase [Clostridium sp.]